jgi:hypothetical protein
VFELGLGFSLKNAEFNRWMLGNNFTTPKKTKQNKTKIVELAKKQVGSISFVQITCGSFIRCKFLCPHLPLVCPQLDSLAHCASFVRRSLMTPGQSWFCGDVFKIEKHFHQ